MSGVVLILLGVWGALIPFIGPYFDYAYTPAEAWDYTTGRLLLEILPGAGAVIGGLLVVGSANRVAAMIGGWLAALSGAWFVLGVQLSTIWGGATVGDPVGGTSHQVFEYVGFFGGLGVVIVFSAAFALGRFAVVGAREVERARQPVTSNERGAAEPVATSADKPGTTSRRRRFRSRRSQHASAR